jgi:hypothetical protein
MVTDPQIRQVASRLIAKWKMRLVDRVTEAQESVDHAVGDHNRTKADWETAKVKLDALTAESHGYKTASEGVRRAERALETATNSLAASGRCLEQAEERLKEFQEDSFPQESRLRTDLFNVMSKLGFLDCPQADAAA